MGQAAAGGSGSGGSGGSSDDSGGSGNASPMTMKRSASDSWFVSSSSSSRSELAQTQRGGASRWYDDPDDNSGGEGGTEMGGYHSSYSDACDDEGLAYDVVKDVFDDYVHGESRSRNRSDLGSFDLDEYANPKVGAISQMAATTSAKELLRRSYQLQGDEDDGKGEKEKEGPEQPLRDSKKGGKRKKKKKKNGGWANPYLPVSRVPSQTSSPPTSVSFSGLKTHLRRFLENEYGIVSDLEQDDVKRRLGDELPDLAAGINVAITEVLRKKALEACEHTGARTLVVAGGVSANTLLRNSLQASCDEHEIALHIPPIDLCTDNGGMICRQAYHLIMSGQHESPLEPYARQWMKKATK